jgi:hypothetical protein
MRTNKELLILLRRRLRWIMFLHWPDGLCDSVKYLYRKHTINYAERVRLLDYLHKHKPLTTETLTYWWMPGKVKPRLKFLNNLISEL